MEIFPEKTLFRNLGPRKFFLSPKLGARSPPLSIADFGWNREETISDWGVMEAGV